MLTDKLYKGEVLLEQPVLFEFGGVEVVKPTFAALLGGAEVSPPRPDV